MTNSAKMLSSMILVAVIFPCLSIFFHANGRLVEFIMHIAMFLLVGSALIQKRVGAKIFKGKSDYDAVLNELDLRALDLRTTVFVLATFILYLSFGVLAGTLILSIVYM